jgi:L-threonylcarbamoyladenylate synthase
VAATVEQAAQALADGRLVAFPTETVYGLGARADSDAAVAKIFAAKGRPSDHPLIVHVASPSAVPRFAASVPAFAEKLMAEFWPGPLTVILPKNPGVANASTGGQASIGLRCPAHPVGLSLLRECAKLGIHGLAAPSANTFGRVSPTKAEHVAAEFPAQLAAGELTILDGGACEVGIESTIIDCTRGEPVLLRPGAITADQASAACGQRVLLAHEAADATDAPAPKASGTLAQHYAPNAKVRVMNIEQIQAALDVLGADAKHMAVYVRGIVKCKSAAVVVRRMPDDAAEVAKQLYAALREFDAQGVKLIWIEELPTDTDWAGVADRVARASAV